MAIPYIPPRATRSDAAPAMRATSRLRAQFRRGLTAITGQVATFTRAATGTLLDSRGATVTAVHSMPRYESRTWEGSASIGLRLSTDDCTYPCDWAPETGTYYVELVEAGTRTTAGAGLLYVGNDGQTGARLTLDSDGTNYRATIHNGTSSQSISLASATPTTGQAARIAVQIEDTGGNQRVRLLLRVAGVNTITAWSSTVTRAAAWGTGATVRLNRVGSAGTQGSTWVRQVAYSAGLLTADDMGGRL
jgi:hypothetical protein